MDTVWKYHLKAYGKKEEFSRFEKWFKKSKYKTSMHHNDHDVLFCLDCKAETIADYHFILIDQGHQLPVNDFVEISKLFPSITIYLSVLEEKIDEEYYTLFNGEILSRELDHDRHFVY